MFRRYNHMRQFTIPQKPSDTYDTYGCECITCPPTPKRGGMSVNLPTFKEEERGGGGKSLTVESSVSSAPSKKPLDNFFRYVNISLKDRLLTKILIVSYFVPDVPHVGNCVSGAKGSAKSTFHKLLKQLIDPSTVQVLDLPSDKNELLQVLFHHYVVWFDNINYLPSWISDLFCRAHNWSGSTKEAIIHG